MRSRLVKAIAITAFLLVPNVLADSAGIEWKILGDEAKELYRTGKLNRALVVAKKALEVAEANVGPSHLDVATALNTVARLYDAKGLYAKAEPLIRRALRIAEKTGGPNDSFLAATLTLLASHYKTQGQHVIAEPLYKHALVLFEAKRGTEHLQYTFLPEFLSALKNLAEIYEMELIVVEKTMGPNHPDVAKVLEKLALVFGNEAMIAEALDPGRDPANLYERALKIYEQALGSNDPKVASCLIGLGSYYDILGDYYKAVPDPAPLYVRALKIYGPTHPEFDRALSVLSQLYRATGRKEEAEKLDAWAASLWNW